MPRLINAFEQLFASDSLSGGPYLALNYSSLSGGFTVAETITGGTSGATAVIQNDITPQITCRTVSGEFQVGETITGGTSAATATLDNFFLYDFPNGASPLENGKIDFFESGSSTVRKTTYSDAAETTANANPLIINGDGRVPNVYGTGSYRAVLSTATGVQIAVRDPIGGDDAGGFGSDWSSTTTYSETDVVRDADKYWQSLVDGNSNNKPSTDGGTNWAEVDFLDIATNTTDIAGKASLTGAVFTGAISSTAGDLNLVTNTALPDADATLTAAQLLGSEFTITPTVARTLTTDTAANIITQLSGSVDNSNFEFTVVNLAGFDVTIAAGASVTLVGNMVVSDGSATFRVRRLTSSTVSVTRLSSDTSEIFGINQTVQDVTGSRSVSVNYTNTESKAISVSVSFTAGALTPIVNGVALFAGAGITIPTSGRGGATFPVPAGAVYSISGSGLTVDKWTEQKL